MFEYIPTGVFCDTEEKIREVIREEMTEMDVVETAEFEYTVEDFIRELCRLESPMYYAILEKTEERMFDDYVCEEEDEDE